MSIISSNMYIRSINEAIDLVNNLLSTKCKFEANQNKNESNHVILFLDIDGTIFSPHIGKKFVENEICILADLVYSYNSNNLIFLTARDQTLKSYTKNQLNKSGLLHKGSYIDYNIICSPYDDEGNSTKGEYLVNYIKSNELDKINNLHIIFIDDQYEHIESVSFNINKYLPNVNFKSIHYKHKL
jgi:hypothetical protein